MLMVARTSYTYIFFDAEIRSVGIIKYTGEKSGQWVLAYVSIVIYVCIAFGQKLFVQIIKI